MFTLLLLIPYFGVRALHDPDPPDISSPASAYLGLRGLNCTGAAQRPRDSVTWGPQVGVSLNSPYLSPIWPCPSIQPVTSEREQMLPSLMFVTPPRGSGSVSKATFQFQFPRRTRDTSPLQHQLSWSCFLLTDFGMIMNNSYVYNVSLFSTRKPFDPAPDKDNFYQYIIMNTYTNIKNIQVDYFPHIIGRCLKIDMFALLTPLSSPRSRSLISFSFAETGKKSASAGLEPATVCAGDRFSATRLAIPLAPWVFRYNYGDHYDVSVTHSRSDQTLPSTRLHPVVRSLNQMGFSLPIPPANPLCLQSNLFTLLTPPARPHFYSPSNIAFAKTARDCFSATRLTSPTAPWVFRYIPSPLTSTHTPPSPVPCPPAASHQPSTRPNLHLLQPRKSSNISRLTPRDVTGSPTNQHPPCYSTKSHAQRPITNLLLLTALLFMIALGLDVHIDDAHDEDCDNSALTPTPPAQGILQRLLSAFTPARPLEAPASNPPAPHQSPLSETCPPQYAPSTFPRQDESLFSGSGTADDQTPPSAVSQPPNMTQPSDQPSHTIPPGNQMESPQSHTPAQPQHTSADTQLPSAAQRPTSAECQSVPDTRGKSSPLDSQQHRPINGDRKCLVIHDDHHKSLFPINRHGLQIVSHNAGSLKSLSPNKLDDLINKHRPESLFLHLGINDIQRLNRHPDAIVDDLEDIMNHILHETTIQLCVSTILRTNNPDLNKKIEYVNRWIFQISNKLRRESRGASERIFTRDNSAIDKAILLQKDGISLNDYGTIKLSIRLISGLNKTLTNSRYRNG